MFDEGFIFKVNDFPLARGMSIIIFSSLFFKNAGSAGPVELLIDLVSPDT